LLFAPCPHVFAAADLASPKKLNFEAVCAHSKMTASELDEAKQFADFIAGMIDTLTVRERLCIRFAPFIAVYSPSASVRPTAPQRTRVVVERSVQRALLSTITLTHVHARIQ